MIHVLECPVCQNTDLKEHLKTKDFTVSKLEFAIKKCTSCGLGITTPRPTPDRMGDYYLSDDYISHTNKANSLIDRIYLLARTYTLRWKYQLLQEEASRSTTLLDYGSGTGHFLKYCYERGMKVKGIEPADNARSIANAQLKDELVFKSLSDLPETFDLITLWHVLEHIPNLSETLQSLRSKLNPGGRIIIAVPNPTSWDSIYYDDFWAGYDTPRHLWHFSRRSMESLLSRNQLKLKNLKPLVLDAFYISLLSEKYKNDGKSNIRGMINAFINGVKSNNKAAKTKEYSSLIYIATNENRNQ